MESSKRAKTNALSWVSGGQLGFSENIQGAGTIMLKRTVIEILQDGESVTRQELLLSPPTVRPCCPSKGLCWLSSQSQGAPVTAGLSSACGQRQRGQQADGRAGNGERVLLVRRLRVCRRACCWLVSTVVWGTSARELEENRRAAEKLQREMEGAAPAHSFRPALPRC